MQEILSNTIIHGDCIKKLEELPENSVDLIFADPPYNLQLDSELYRPNQTKVEGVFDEWDKFDTLKSYDIFTRKWLSACRRVLKNSGTIWVIGSYHNIYRVGSAMQDLGFWFLNDILWIKTNPMPNFMGTRFNNAHETMIWASKKKGAKYTFHYKTMKTFNDDLQMRSDWYIPICTGGERIKHNGQKAHSTQKPEELLYRIILSTSNVGDLVLDPFLGSGTTGAVAKKLQRNFIGIEREEFYIHIAKERIDNVVPIPTKHLSYNLEIKPPKVPFGNLIKKGFVSIGENIYSANKKSVGTVNADSSISLDGFTGSIHKVGAKLQNKKSLNGWLFWYIKRNDKYILIDELRLEYIGKYISTKK